MIKNIIITIIVAIVVISFYILFPANIKLQTETNEAITIFINDQEFRAEIADTDEKRVLGLSGRENLPEDSGLLFIFPTSDYYPFWMKDMNFPIDILWIDENWTIVDITENVQPESYPQTFRPQTPAKYVLEINAGLSKDLNIKRGDKIRF